MKAAVFANPNNNSVPEKLAKLLLGFDSVVAFEDFGGEMFAKVCQKAELIQSQGIRNYVQSLEKNVKTAYENGAEVVICLGGDGLSSYVASSLIKICQKKDQRPSMIGWAGGTANVGPIVTSECSENIDDYKKTGFDAIEVCDGDKVLGYAFNDLIIGNSFLGTVDSKMVNLEAKAMVEREEKKVCLPSEDIVSSSFVVKLNGKRQENVGFDVKQICVSTLQNDNLYGRAVLGGLGQAMGIQSPAAVALTDRIAVDSRPETWNYKGVVRTAHICFDSGDFIEFEGLTENGQIIIDGNPFIKTQKTIGVRCISNAITVLRSDL